MQTFIQNRSPQQVLLRVQKYVSAVDFQADKDEILTTVEREGADITVIELLQTLPLQDYHTPKEIEKALLG
jgi:hypothetical protein